jgi:endonuclease/exonuclease/phosphatase family metal-dependent hydrolase
MFSELRYVSLKVITWNLAGQTLVPQFMSELPFLLNANETFPDIFIIGFQEVVSLNTSNVYQGKNQELSNQLDKTIVQTLFNCSKQEYVPVFRKIMVGQFIILLVKKHMVKRISNLSKLKVMTGFKGMAGNKGAVALRFELYGKSLLFINVHLDSGKENLTHRIANLKYILQETESSSLKTDFVCLFGDMNFRLDMDKEEIKVLLEEKEYTSLYEFDQLKKIVEELKEIEGFDEAPIGFKPTYKYVKDEDTLDWSRNPAFCDRILIKQSEEVIANCQYYNSHVDLLTSDHRPVTAIFSLEIPVINKRQKSIVQENILEELNSEKMDQGDLDELSA